MHPHPVDLELAVAQRQLTAQRWAFERMLLRHARSAHPATPRRVPTWPQLLTAAGAAVEPMTLDPVRVTALRDVVAELGRIAADAGLDPGVAAPLDDEAPVVTYRRLGRLAEATAGHTVPVEPRRAARVEALLRRLAPAAATDPVAAPRPGVVALAARWLSVLDRLTGRHGRTEVCPRCP